MRLFIIGLGQGRGPYQVGEAPVVGEALVEAEEEWYQSGELPEEVVGEPQAELPAVELPRMKDLIGTRVKLQPCGAAGCQTQCLEMEGDPSEKPRFQIRAWVLLQLQELSTGRMPLVPVGMLQQFL